MVMMWLQGWWPNGRDDDEGGRCWSEEDLQLHPIRMDGVGSGKWD